MNNDEIKGHVLYLIIDSEKMDTSNLIENTDKIKIYEDAAATIKEYKEFVLRKKILLVSYQRGKVFKRFKEKEKLMEMVKQFKISASAIIFKINVLKLIDRHLRLTSSSMTLNFLKISF